MESRAKLLFWVALASAALLLFAGSASVPLLDPDEARFARTSEEMSRSGDLVVPTFEGRPRLVKPPLIHWTQVAIFGLFGSSEWTARLHAALATLGAILLAAWVARRRYGEEGAMWTAAVMLSTPLVMALGRIGTIDSLLAVSVFGVIALDMAEPNRFSRFRGVAVGALLGLAFLAKGPVGVVVPLLVMLAGRTASRRELLPGWRATLQGIATWCAVVLPWGLAFIFALGFDTAEGTLRGEAFERYLGGSMHSEPPWFYLMVVLVGFLPWSGALVLAIVRAFRMRKEPAAQTALYAAAGFVAGVVFFSLSPSKLPNYLLPLAALPAILVAWELGQELRQPKYRTGPGVLVVSLGLCAVALTVAGMWGFDGAPRLTALLGGGTYGVGTLVALPGWIRRRPRWVYTSAVVTAGAFLFAALGLLLPALTRNKTSYYVIQAVPELRIERPLVMVDMKVPSLTYYLDRIPQEVKIGDVGHRLDLPDDPLFVFDESDLPSLSPTAAQQLSEIGREGKYVVFKKAGHEQR
jgi:4-amino-4-deoxy-L-arabinose transferase-like glycosyltransferase